MSEKLRRLQELAGQVTMTPEDREDQRISFAYGNTGFENERMTRDEVIRASQAMKECHCEPAEAQRSLNAPAG